MSLMIIKFMIIFVGSITASIMTRDMRYLWLLLILVPSFVGDVVRMAIAKMNFVESGDDNSED